MSRSVLRSVPLAVLVVAMLTPSGGATSPQPSLGVDQPTAGQAISKSAGPFAAAGGVTFAEPAPSNTPLFLRYEAVDGNNCGRRYLSETDAPDAGNSCQSNAAHTTLVGTSFTRDWPADPTEVGLPLTIDASRNITGQVNITSEVQNTPSPGNWVTLDLVVRLGATSMTQSFDSGLFQGGSHTFTVNLDIPGTLDRIDVNAVQVDLVWHRVIHLSQQGQSVMHTYVELDNPATFVSVPTYTASFNRAVELSVDSPTFATNKTVAAVDPGAGTFSAPVPTSALQTGDHTLYARAIQGGVASATQAVPFTLTA